MIVRHRHALKWVPLSKFVTADDKPPMQFCKICNRTPEDGEITGQHEDGRPAECND